MTSTNHHALGRCDTNAHRCIRVAEIIRPNLLVAWAVCTLAAAVLVAPVDVALSSLVDRYVPANHWMHVLQLLKLPGHFGFTIGIAVLLCIWHRRRWLAAAFVCVSGMVSGIFCVAVKWAVGRTRPDKGIPAFSFRPFRGGPVGLFHESNLSFPSGHTCLAFATATAMSILLPRFRGPFFAVACVVAAERIAQNSHYASDVVAAAGLGVLATLSVVVLGRAAFTLKPWAVLALGGETRSSDYLR